MDERERARTRLGEADRKRAASDTAAGQSDHRRCRYAGLVCAEKLIDAGHEVTVLEGRNRVGGRIETLRTPFAPGLYAEAGAMRLPRSHRLTMAYVEKFGLETFPFTLSNPICSVHLHGNRRQLAEVDANPSLLEFDGVGEATVLDMWEGEIEQFRKRLATEGDDAYRDLVQIRGAWTACPTPFFPSLDPKSGWVPGWWR